MLNNIQKEIQYLESENSTLRVQLLEAKAIIKSLKQENESLSTRISSYKSESVLSFDSTFVTSQYLDTVCDNCENSVPSSSFEDHLSQCLKFLTRCPVCNLKLPVTNLTSHIETQIGHAEDLAQDIEKCDISSIELRVAHGARINSISSDLTRNTLMHIAVKTGRPEIVEYLLKKGLDINSQNAFGEVPLHLVCGKNKDLDMIKYLLSKGAECWIKNSLGDSCVDLAKRNGFHEAVLFFQQFSSRPSSSFSSRSFFTQKKYLS